MNEQKNSTDKVCLITGVGPGTGTALTQRFLKGGYKVAMLARSTDRLAALSDNNEHAYAFPCDVSDKDMLTRTVEEIQTSIGVPNVVIHNAVGGSFGNFMDVEPELLLRNFQINTMALLYLARLTVPHIISTGGGAILATGNTSAYRGKANFAGFAPTKAAQRILMESIARDVGPQGVHAAYIAIDAVIDVPWAREQYPEKPDEFFCQPADIAEECFHIAHQRLSTWSSDIIIRPFGEAW